MRELGPRVPLFGVCMGHQCIGQVFGGAIVRAPGGVMHGKTSLVFHNNTGLLKVRCPSCHQTGGFACLSCMHGYPSDIASPCMLQGLDNPFEAARYHSLVIDKDSCPEELEVTAWTEDGVIMGVQHKQFAHIQGVQFHPESVITARGKTIVQNFIDTL